MKKLIACLVAIVLVSMMSMVPVCAQQGTPEGLKNSPDNITIMGQFAEVNEDNVRLRADAGLSAPVLMYLHRGYIVEYSYAHSDDPDARKYVDGMWWRRVHYFEAGVRGYVAEQYLNFIG